MEQGQPGQPPDDGGEGTGPDADEQIMSRLPRSRPQRRSERRTGGARRGATAAKPSAAKAQGRSTAGGRAVDRARAASRQRSPAPERAPRPALDQPRTAESRAPGMPQLALGAAVDLAKVPFRLTGALSRETGRLIRRGLRRG